METEVKEYSAEETLARMREIVETEMLVHGLYVSSVTDYERLEAPCGGRRHCAIGALWVANGVRYEPLGGGRVTLPGVTKSERFHFAATRPELALAHECLNEAAIRWARDRGASIDMGGFDEYGEICIGGFESVSAIEALFEGSLDPGHDQMLEVIDAATVILAERRKEA